MIYNVCQNTNCYIMPYKLNLIKFSDYRLKEIYYA